VPSDPQSGLSFGSHFHDSVRDAAQGGRIELIVGAPRPQPVRWPHRIGTVPQLAASRQEREADWRLSGTTAPCLVLSGMGGVGKTQLAAAYATDRWNRSELDLLMWVNASSAEGIIAAFAQAGVELCGAEPGEDVRAATAFLNLLSRPEAPRWLVVVDDLGDPAALQGLWPPVNPRGRTLVTTRRRDAALDAEGRSRIDIGLFSPEESLAYLHGRLGSRSRRVAGAEPLAELLGGLPLALGQAAAFILDQPGLTCEDYRRLLEDRTVALAELSPEAAPDGYGGSLHAAWSLSIEQADRHAPEGLAGGILKIAALLDPAGIPMGLFTSASVLGFLADVTGTEGLRALQVSAALGRLHRLSLIDADGALVRMHALVQRAVLEMTTSVERSLAAESAADALQALWPEPADGPNSTAVLWTNLSRLIEKAGRSILGGGVHPVFFEAGNSVGAQGQVRMAMGYFSMLRFLIGQVHVDDHPDAIEARHGFARWQGESGDVLGAVEGFQAVLADRIRVLGDEHPRTFATRQRLLYWRGEAGDLETAIAETESLLADRLRLLGPEHFDVLITRSLRARWQGRSGDAVGAAAANESLLADCLQTLGADHPFTLAVRHNLAHWRGEAGDPQGAAAATEALLADRLRVLGPDHPDTFRSRQNLAGWLGEAGDTTAAVDGLTSVLHDQLRVLGPDHPDVLAVRNDLARWTARSDRVEEAIDAFTELLADCERILDPEHRYTRIVAHNLAHWRERRRAGIAGEFSNVAVWADGGLASNTGGRGTGGIMRGGMMGTRGGAAGFEPNSDIGTWLTEDDDIWGQAEHDED
jgi:hypothetical protein